VLKNSLISIFIILTLFSNAQNSRINEHNDIGWYNLFANFKLNNKLTFHSEYQWRRTKTISNWQQGVLKLGISYQFLPKVQARIGYANIETFAYGETPINSFGKIFTEDRMFETITITDKVSIVEISNRLMLEQRWTGKYSNFTLQDEDLTVFTNRFRYQVKLQVPLKRSTIQDKTPYLALYDEILLNFGDNVGENIFDQNRIGLLLGYKYNKSFRIEAGAMNQLLQLGREINNRNLLQYNTGLVINAIFSLDISRKEN
jgi:hypothetical protein